MPIPSDTHVPGDTGHIGDHNNIADTLTTLTTAIPAAVAVEASRAAAAEALLAPLASPTFTGIVVTGPAGVSAAAGATFDGATDDSAALNSDQAASRTLQLPGGTAIVGTQLTWNQSKLRIQGAGMYQTTIKSTGGLLGILKQIVTGTGFVSEIEICDMTLDCSSAGSYAIQANGATITRLVVRRVRFINCPSSAVTGGYAANYVIEDCVLDGAGLGLGTLATFTALPMESLIIRRNRLRWIHGGINIGSTGFHSAYVEISDNDIDGGWWLLKAVFTGTSAAAYTATGLSDTGAAFSGIAANTTVRAMPVRQSGTFVSGSSGTYVKDTAAAFVTSAIKRGEIIRAGTSFAVVSKVISQTALHVEEWLDQAAYTPVAPPATGAAYTVYGIILGNIIASTATTLTVTHGAGHGSANGWYDLTGTEITPAAGTLYEVLPGSGGYPIYCDPVTEKLQITGNRIRRGWCDGIECFGNRAVITGNIVEDGQDEGIVVQGTTGGLVAGNLVKHNGTSGLDINLCTNTEIGPNLYVDNCWGAPLSAALGQLSLAASTGVTVTGGKAYNTAEAAPQYGLYISGTNSGIKVIGFTGVGGAAADVYVASTVGAGQCALLDINGVLAYGGTTNGQLTRMAGAGVPALIASPGSVFTRTDGAGGTTLYVKESGNGAAGWTAFSSGSASTMGGQAAYSKITSSAAQALVASAWTAVTGAPSITLPNDGNTYQVIFTPSSIQSSVAENLYVGIGVSTSTMLATTGVNFSQTSQPYNGRIQCQAVTGSGQAVTIYGWAASGTPTLTLVAGGATGGPCELAAYRVV